MNDLKFDILQQPTTVQSELDREMEQYINHEPPYSKEELAAIRKRVSNQLKEKKKETKPTDISKESPKVVEEKVDENIVEKTNKENKRSKIKNDNKVDTKINTRLLGHKGTKSIYSKHEGLDDMLLKLDATEEEYVPALNKFYEDKGVDVRFVQTNPGNWTDWISGHTSWDAIEVLVGDQEEGEGYTVEMFNKDGSSRLSEITSKIRSHIDGNMGDKYYELDDSITKTKNDEELYDELLETFTINDLFLDDNQTNRARFAHRADIITGVVEDDEDNVEEYNTEYVSGKGTGRRLSITDGIGAVVSLVAEPLTFGSHDQYTADMSGGITLKDGSVVSYEYIFDKRDDILKHSLKKADNKLTEEKIESFGSEQEYNDYLSDNAWVYFSEDEQEYYKLKRELENVKSGRSEGDSEAITNRLEQIADEKGWKVLYDDDGNYIDIKRSEPEEGSEEEGIETIATQLANNNDAATLEKLRQQSAIRLENLAKIAGISKEQIQEEMRGSIVSGLANEVGGWFDFSGDSYDNDVKSLEQIIASGDLFGSDKPLTNLPGGSELAKQFKEELINFKTLSRAYDLNINVAQNPEENAWAEVADNLSRAFTGEDVFGTIEDEARDAFEAVLEQEGYDVERFGESEEEFGWNRYTGESISKIGTDLAPLLSELWVLKKVGGTKKIHNSVAKLANVFTKGNKSKTWAKVVDKLVVPAIATPIEWSVGEVMGEQALGGMGATNSLGENSFKAHTINTETGETNFSMPVTMGLMGPAWATLSGRMYSKFAKTAVGRHILPKVTNPEGFMASTRRGLGKMAGQGSTGSAMLLVAESVQSAVDSAIKDEDISLAEKLKDTWTIEHFVNTAAALSILSAGKVHPSWKDAFKRDIAHLRGETVESNKAAKELKLEKDKEGYYEETSIDNAVNKKIEEIKKDESLSKEEREKKIKEAQVHGKHLKVFNEVKAIKAKYKEKDRMSEYYKEQWEAFENLKKDLTSGSKDYDAIAKMKPWEVEELLRRNGIEIDSQTAKYYMSTRDVIDYISQVSDMIGYKKSDPTRNDYIRDTLSIERNKNRIKEVEKSIKDGKGGTNLEAELRALKETNKKLYEANDIRFKQYQAKWNSLLKAEIAAAKNLAGKLGSSVKQYNATQWSKLRDKNGKPLDPEADAAYVGGVLRLNMRVLRLRKNLGAPIHEVIHHILRNSFKNKKGKITSEGINIIKQLVNKFSLKEQAIIQKRIDDNYRYEENLDGTFRLKDGKKIEKPEEDYYEEYITSISDAIKNGEIKFNIGTMRKASKLVYPWLKNIGMSNLYKYDLNGSRSTKAAQDLYNLLGDVSAAKTVRAETIEGLKELVGKEPGIHPDAESKSKDIYQNEKVSENLGITKKSTKEIIEKNREIENKIIEENLRDANGNLQASTRNQQRLIENNMAASFKLALEAANKAKNITLEEGLKYDDVNEWFSEYNLKLVDLARTYRAERVWDVKKNKPISPPEKVPFGAYMGGLLPKKYSGILEAGKAKIEAKSMTETGVAKMVGKIATTTSKAFETDGRTIKIADRLGPQGKNIKNMVTKTLDVINGKPFSIKRETVGNEIIERKIDLTKATFKSLKNIVLKEVQKEIFGIDPKTGNLSKPDVKNAQMVISKHADLFKTMLPEHHTTKMVNIGTKENPIYEVRPDRATGIENVLLEAFYDKGVRKDNLTPWTKKKNIKTSDFLEVFGIMERGVPNSYKKESNTSARIHALVKQVERMVVNQSVREKLKEMGFGKEEWFSVVAEGRSETMYSKSVYRNENVSESVIKDFDSKKRSFHREIGIQGLSPQAIGRAYDIAFGKDGLIDLYENSLRSNIIKDYVSLLKPYIVKSGTYTIKKKNFPIDVAEFLTKANVPDAGKTIKDWFGVKESIAELHRNPIQRQRYQEFNTDILSEKINKRIEEITDSKEIQTIKDQMIVDEIRGKSHLENGTINPGRGMAFYKVEGYVKNHLSKIPGYENLVTYRKKKATDKKTKEEKRWIELEFEGGKTRNIKLPESSKFDGEQKTTQEMIDDNVSKKEMNLREENAQFHWDRVNETLERAAELVESKVYGNEEAAMLFAGFLGNMKTSLRAAALFKYAPVNPPTRKLTRKERNKEGKLVDKKNFEYEHGITAKKMAVLLAGHYFFGKKIDLKSLKDSYSVGVIHVDFNKNFGEVFQERMQFGYKIGDIPPKRWFNEWTAMGEAHAVRDIYTNKVYGKEQVDYWNKIKVDHKKSIKEGNKAIQSIIGPKYSKSSKREIIEDSRTIDKAIALGRNPNKKARGASVFDFDETVGVSENFVIATKGGKTKKIASDKWPFVGDKMVKEGWKMDFSDFNKVTKGKPGPLMQKMKNQIKKYGSDNVFILTARAKESAPAIHEWLKTQGIKIPLENITGLGNSTGEAKAMWMLRKFEEGYNDMYFVDDALPNVKAVREVLNQLDIKSKVQQVRYSKSKDLSKDFNQILEEVKGIGAEKRYSEAKGRLAGDKVGKTFFGTPGMEDFSGLVTYAFAGKGKRGEAHIKFFTDNLQKPFNRAYNEIHNRKQSIGNDYKALRKAMPEVRKRLDDVVDGVYNVDQAIRVYNWNKAGYSIPGLSKTDLKTLTKYVENDASLSLFANQLSKITMLPEGYLKPGENWLGENITMDMNNVVERVYRKDALAEFRQNRKEIFGEWKGGKIVGENMNKIEAAYGPKHREALENMLWRMENGTNRTVGADSNTNKWMNWVNDATGTIMFFNQKSAVLQTISSLNYINGTFNNPFRAAQAFANQPQYWKDFAMIFNSNMMVQRRAGLKINIEAAELLERVGNKKGGFGRFRKYLLEKGFIPTKYADSFAIASGGATYYRNSVRKYKKQGLSTKEAEAKAWEDFMMMTEATQQSSRPDLISMQQASALGRPILAFANTPMQMFRRHKRRIQDIANRRGNTIENTASALYYGFAQTMIFSFLTNAMFAVDDESDDPKDIKHAEKQKERYLQTIIDSYLRGMGTGGASISALKNGILSFFRESEKYNPDYANTVIDMINVSPPIGSKARKLYSAGKTYRYDRDIIPHMGFSLDNPATLAIANVISAITNLPTDRVVMKLTNLKDASNSDFENWQRIAMSMGISKWAMGLRDEELEAEKDALEKRVKGKKKKEKKAKQDATQIEVNKKKKDGRCSAISKSGNRCANKVEPGASFCTIHVEVKQNKSGKKIQCKKIKSNGKRCKMQTSAASGYCYYHD